MQVVRHTIIKNHSQGHCAHESSSRNEACCRRPDHAPADGCGDRDDDHAQRAACIPFDFLDVALVKAKERTAAALLALAAADLEVASLTTEAKAADARLPAKPQCRSALHKAWETTTAGWTTKRWVDLEAASRCRHGAQRWTCWQ